MSISLFQQIIKSLPRRQIKELASTFGSNKYCKRFTTYSHLVTMIYAQLAGQTSLRDLENSFNASPARHYHLGCGSLKRSTLCDAYARRPSGVFEAILHLLLRGLSGSVALQADEFVRLLDSTTIGLFAKTHKALRYRANNSAIKLHMMFDPDAVMPTWFEITPARFHDSKVCSGLKLEAKATYVFDPADNNAAFWNDIEQAGAFFVTRPKTNLVYEVESNQMHHNTIVVADEVIRLEGNPGKKYQKQLRRIEIFDEERGEEIAFITNDFARDSQAIANLYKRRWQIELFFKWIKQNLKMKTFLAKNPKAIRLQIVTALIAYILLKQFHRLNRLDIPLKRLAAIVQNYTFNLSAISDLIKPPPMNSNRTNDQLCLDFTGQ